MSCAIHARDLRFTYPNGVQGLDGLDLHIGHGERVAVLGPNGAGKTTLMLHLNALLHGAGELEVAGLRVGHDDVRDLRARVGLIFQDPDDQLFMPTVREDVAFGPLNLGLSKPEVSDRVQLALEAVRMSEHAARAPHQLSLGQRRRVAIASVLAMHPSLLVLDEPSANLDPRTRRELMETLDAIDRTLVIVTHDLPLAAMLCERAVLLSAGRIVADGPTREILADEQLLAANDLELPEGFSLRSLPASPRSRPAASASAP
jgi:cobalt/nickel transport system ATP-binding protein